MNTANRSRQGTILIIVAGVMALLAGMSVAFLARMRNDVEDMVLMNNESQARIMLMAACNYLQEASRVGWESSKGSGEESFGWIDVRDGQLGPKLKATNAPDDSNFPVGSFQRFPMYVMKRPPFAVQLTATYNPIRTPYSPGPVSTGDARFGMPYLINPDPQPVVRNGWNGFPGAGVSATNWNDYENGDSTPRINSVNKSWFRIRRESGATFVVTCGAGGTMGYRDWSEVLATAGASDLFGNSSSLFENLRLSEIRLWYRVEWNPAGLALDYHMLDHSIGRNRDHYMVWPMNASHSTAGHEYRTQMHAVNMAGTILWIQRLIHEPTHW